MCEQHSTTPESDLAKEVLDSVLAVKREPGHCSDGRSTTTRSKETCGKPVEREEILPSAPRGTLGPLRQARARGSRARPGR